jgi:hypothetical protein
MHNFSDADFFIFEFFMISLSILIYRIFIKKCRTYDEENQEYYDVAMDEVITKVSQLKIFIFLANMIFTFVLVMLAILCHPEYSKKWDKHFANTNYSHIISCQTFNSTLIQDNGDTLKGSLSLENKAIYEIDVLKSKWGDNLVNVKYLTKNDDKYDDKNELIMITNETFESLEDLIDSKYIEDKEKQRLKSLIK